MKSVAELGKHQYFSKIESLIDEDHIDEARVALETAQKTYPDDSDITRLAGLLAEKEEDWNKVLLCYKSAIELDKHQPEWVYLVAVRLLCERGNWSESAELCHHVLEINSRSAQAHRYLGLCSENLGDPNLELFHYQTAIKLEQRQPLWVYDTVFDRLQKRGKHSDCLEFKKKLAQAYPESALSRNPISLLASPKILDDLQSSQPKVILHEDDIRYVSDFLETENDLTFYKFIYDSETERYALTYLNDSLEENLLEIKWVPTFCLFFLSFSEKGQYGLEPLSNWWIEKGNSNSNPPQFKIDIQQGKEVLQADFWKLVSSCLMNENANLAGRLSSLHRQYLSLRTMHEDIQNAFSVVEGFLSQAKLPNLQLSFENQPTKKSIKSVEGEAQVLTQLLPLGTRGLAAIDLHIGKRIGSSHGDILISVEVPEDQTCLAKWKVPYRHLEEGWLQLDLPSIDTGFQREAILKIEFHTQIGPIPHLSLGATQPLPECQVLTEKGDSAFQHSLAFRLWTGLPGSRRVTSPYSVVSSKLTDSVEPITSGYLGQRSLLQVREVTPNLPDDPFAYIEILNEGQKLLLHPRKGKPTIAMLPYCFPPGAQSLTATVETAHAEASIIQYAVALIEEGADLSAIFESENAEVSVAFSGWKDVHPLESTQLKTTLEAINDDHYHIVMATRLAPDSHANFAWAHWLNFHIE